MPKDTSTIDDTPFQVPAGDDDLPAVIPETGQAGEQSKVRIILGLLKRLMGVSDVANLIGDSTDEFERMLSVLRFAFSKELKFVRQRIGKPYNSALGTPFPSLPSAITTDPALPAGQSCMTKANTSGVTGAYRLLLSTRAHVNHVSIRSSASKTSSKGAKPAAGGTGPQESLLKSSMSSLSIQHGASDASGSGNNGTETEEQVVVFLCEQVSHHPPISSAYYACPGKGVEMTCVDQISAKVSGMSELRYRRAAAHVTGNILLTHVAPVPGISVAVQVTPGEANKGLFISLQDPSLGSGEQYQVTHPIAQVNGILKGTFYGTIGDKITVTCRGGKPGKTKLKAIIEYRDESWLGKPKFALEGIVYNYNVDKPEEEEWSKIKHVPSDRVVANIEGSWRKQIKYKRKGEKDWTLLIDLAHLGMTPRSVRPLSEQEERESRRLWDPVTAHMVTKNWSEATKQKQSIEQVRSSGSTALRGHKEDVDGVSFVWQRQRDIANELKQKGIEYVSSPSKTLSSVRTN
ncbi:hypothetical protein QFC22_003006 [Naganishia vaughanmartiniae]|uniref:Uncharacterized protein n=1 Tax=Naganishia vaughanmartiniae TaxID=1424756 RepID=A0ACC2X907_9TREE|nr:hypothetical protein QFC22_003006 [Naganishia vaughanmartiniae]